MKNWKYVYIGFLHTGEIYFGFSSSSYHTHFVLNPADVDWEDSEYWFPSLRQKNIPSIIGIGLTWAIRY